MAFCTECGRRVAPTARFCEECGTPITSASAPSTTPFALDIHLAWATPGGAKSAASAAPLQGWTGRHGLLVTHLQRLARCMNVEPAAHLDGLGHLLATGLKHGILWHVLDLARADGGEDWISAQAAVAAAMHRITTRGVRVDGVLLLGDHAVVPMAIFPNHAGDPDEAVESDLPYSTLSTADPWEDDSPALVPRVPVGRLPLGHGWGWKDAATYIANLDAALNGAAAGPDVFGLSAAAWRGASEAVLSSLLASAPLHTAPPLQSVQATAGVWNPDCGTYYFNLHGSDCTPFWYGDDGQSHPTVFAPDVIRQTTRIHVLGVEACYGARFIDLTPRESIVLSALAHRTIAFVGATRIAFGPPRPPIGLADVVIQRFLACMRAGCPAGRALHEGLRAVAGADLNPSSVKTILEFTLFGDPFARLPVATDQATGPPLLLPPAGLTTAKPQLGRTRRLALPDSLGQARAAVDATRARIRRMLDAYVRTHHPLLAGIEPTGGAYKSTTGQERERFVYAAPPAPVRPIVIIDTDRQGRILCELVSR